MTSPTQPPKSKKTPEELPEEKERRLRGVYFDILRGYSLGSSGEKEFRIKHFDVQTQTRIDTNYLEIFKKAESKGLLTKAQLLATLLKDGLWTEEEEADLVSRQKNIDGLQSTSTKALNEQMREKIESSIKQAKKELGEIEKKKGALITNTCEQFADRRSSDLIVRLSFYKADGSDLYFSDKEFDLLEREEVTDLVQSYNKATEDLTVENIREVSIADFFTSYYSLVETNLHAFFDKPIHVLTFFQVNLLNYARLFSSILKNLDPPEHIKKDADKLLTFAKNENKKRKSDERKRKREENKPSG